MRVRKLRSESLWANRKPARFNGRIAPGPADYNRNYDAPGQPLWSWHVASVDEIAEWTHDPFGDQVVYPPRDGKPSDIEADPQRWMEEFGGAIRFKAYRIEREITSEEKFYFWVGPKSSDVPDQGTFVIEVDEATASEIRRKNMEGPVGIAGFVAIGSKEYNKDYRSPGGRQWNWYFESIGDVYNVHKTFFPPCDCPDLLAGPSEIDAEWIERNGNRYTPTRYQIFGEIDPTRTTAVANVSNRGMAGTGEKALITGLIIKGGEPRNVVVRALGPSMSAAGVQQVASNPKIEVFQGSSRIATNNDWRRAARANALSTSYPDLAPSDDREAALLLTLMPGAYTLHGTNEDGSEGVVLLEAYDVDSNDE
jgi:hypothetical protein